jgi:hypothetical protein
LKRMKMKEGRVKASGQERKQTCKQRRDQLRLRRRHILRQ